MDLGFWSSWQAQYQNHPHKSVVDQSQEMESWRQRQETSQGHPLAPDCTSSFNPHPNYPHPEEGLLKLPLDVAQILELKFLNIL